MIGYDDLRKEQAEKRERGELMGIGISSLHRDRRRRAVARLRHPGHQDVRLVRDPGPPDRQGASRASGSRRRARATRRPSPRSSPRSSASRSPTSRSSTATPIPRPTASAPTPAARRRSPARRRRWRRARSATRPGRSPRTCWRPTRTTSSGRTASSASGARPSRPRRSRRSPSPPTPTIRPGWRPASRRSNYYDPPNLTFPFGSLHLRRRHRPGTGEVKIRRFVAVDDCGNIINPMIVDGQIHGGLTMGLAPALLEEITYDEHGNNLAGTFMDYLLPTARRDAALGAGQDGHPVAAPSDRRQGRRASRPRSARRRPSPMPSSMRCGTSACATSTSRSRHRRSGASCTRRASADRGRSRGLRPRRRARRRRASRSRWRPSSPCSGRPRLAPARAG